VSLLHLQTFHLNDKSQSIYSEEATVIGIKMLISAVRLLESGTMAVIER